MKTLVAILLACSATALFAASNVPAISIDEVLWSRIDNVNARLHELKKPAPSATLAEILNDATAIVEFTSFDADYQKVRGHAFQTDFVQADALAKRATPGFLIEYGGDYDRYHVNTGYFKGLAKPGSETEIFLRAYENYYQNLFLLDPSATMNCVFNFDFPKIQDQATTTQAELLKEWKTLAGTFKEAFYKKAATLAVECLSPKKPKPTATPGLAPAPTPALAPAKR